ncbi:MAG TPA: tRNA threonylcarbamoyladenosine dehydratase [Bacteroidales bacterium]|nr:tRNA threonylcarbamoyladenosine dehydratase [Bacteroidales bacterium]HCI55261.1 tRNA threonylcarbamoyladenosine dehydratase [Bacteroidales bacterium]HOU95190.1 tRNA threonylcarbamoyladenosine dehydratase [Bacteroidales bacterium]HQG35957.1 tRNA threonylcarbamoyladenosine dehydratase [Bacteroidales bacterium]HQG52979.1 tRNA threonylcarbamoyladenosine dehydratase [Bacteroidales bacterium]
MEEWYSRTEQCIGAERFARLKSSNVLVAGMGGVGAYAAEMLCRAGIGKMTIVDGDIIHPSNRNRQLLALISTEGKPKVLIMEERLKDINPDIEITALDEFIRDERMIEILSEPFDYIVDAIDTLSPKVFLIYHSLRRNYRIVSSMGAGGKFDPLKIRVDDISQTYGCSLARMLRKKLHRLGVDEGFRAVYSPERVDKSRIIESSEEKNKASIVGSISYMPAAFGIVCASVVIRDLAGIEI